MQKRRERAERPIERQKSEIETAIDFRLEEYLIRYCRKINEGTNGVIFRLNIEGASEGAKKDLENLGVDVESDRVVKLLKVYRPGLGEHEYNLHKAAYDALKNADQTKVGRIPKPYLFRDVPLSPLTKEHLWDAGVSIASEDHVEMLIMDYVPGTDLGTILYREALQRAMPEVYPNIEDLDTTDWAQAQRQVAGRLDFREPEMKGGKPNERALAERKLGNENASKLLQHLKKTGFVLHPEILKKLEASLEVLHNAGIAHRDLHERNIMISGNYAYSPDGNGELPEVHIIDFGSSEKFTGRYDGREDIYLYREGEGRYLDDENLLRRYAELSETPDMKKSRIKKEEAGEMKRRFESMRTHEDYQYLETKWMEYFLKQRENVPEALNLLFTRVVSGKADQDRIYRFLGVADAVIARGVSSKQEVKNYLKNQDLSTYQKRIVSSW